MDGPEAVQAALSRASPLETEGGGGFDGEGRWQGPGLPPECPVVPLGVNGELAFYLDAGGQFRALDPKGHSKLALWRLMGVHARRLYDWFPRLDRTGKTVVGWRAEELAERLLELAARRGVWDAFGRLRGPGAWAEDDGTLLLHCGDGLLLRSAAGPDPGGPARALVEERPGLRGRYVYPAGPEGPRPGRFVAAGPLNPAEAVLGLLGTWTWRRPGLDQRLLLGWLGCAMLGGALEWRPMAWITGEAAMGKSTLMGVLKALCGDALVEAASATEAGVRQTVGHSSQPVLLDEQESAADGDNRRMNALIGLARIAASGAFSLRGGQDHQATAFTARCCFLFGSILIPPLAPQDLRRMAILELRPFPPEARPPRMERAELLAWGAALRARLAAGWPRWQATLQAFREGLAERGHRGGGQDQFGALLAAAHLLLHDHEPEHSDVAELTAGLEAATLAEDVDEVPDHEACLRHLRSWQVDAWRGGMKWLLGTLINEARAEVRPLAGPDPPEGPGKDDCAKALTLCGLTLKRDEAGRQCVFVANSHAGTAKIFEGSRWAGGVWSQALKRVPGASVPKSALRVGGFSCRGVLVPVNRVLGWDAEAEPPPAAAPASDGGDDDLAP